MTPASQGRVFNRQKWEPLFNRQKRACGRACVRDGCMNARWMIDGRGRREAVSDWLLAFRMSERSIEMDKDIEELEGDIEEELAAIIGDVVDGKKSSTIKEIQPPESIIRAMAQAATQVLVAFERGSRLGD